MTRPPAPVPIRTAGTPPALAGLPVGQVGILVRDLERTLGRWADVWGVERWKLYEYGPASVPTLSYRGRPGRFRMLLALADTSPQVELIQSLEGPSIYEEWLAEHGEGIHHVGVFVPSVLEASASMRAAGYEAIQSGEGYGLDGDGGFAYFDTAADLGLITELIEVPARRRPPDAVRGRPLDVPSPPPAPPAA